MEGLTEGRMVHYVLPEGKSQAEHRPAIVVKVWSKETGTANLTVFPDWQNDGKTEGIFWATSVPYSEEPLGGTWHWIEKA